MIVRDEAMIAESKQVPIRYLRLIFLSIKRLQMSWILRPNGGQYCKTIFWQKLLCRKIIEKNWIRHFDELPTEYQMTIFNCKSSYTKMCQPRPLFCLFLFFQQLFNRKFVDLSRILTRDRRSRRRACLPFNHHHCSNICTCHI